MAPLLNFAGRTIVITGAASGMGAKTLELLTGTGAEIHAVDVIPINNDDVTAYHCDLGSRSAIDEMVAKLPLKVDVLMNCAGVPNGGRFDGEQVMRINWLGLRHLTESAIPRMSPGSSIVHIASTAGRDWQSRTSTHHELMNAASFDDGLAWVSENQDICGDGYVLSKEAVQFYTHWRAVQLLPAGVRMNSICPGITDTKILADFRAGMGSDIIDHAQAVAGRAARPEEMAPAMLFLADDEAASYINGVNLNIDRGTAAARLSNQSDPKAIWNQTNH